MRISRLSPDVAICDPIVLRDKATVRLVFKPTLTKNKRDIAQPITGEFVYQKKSKDDQWENWGAKHLGELSADSGFSLTLHPGEIDVLFRHLAALYADFQQHGLPPGDKEILVGESTLALPADVSDMIRDVVAQHGAAALTKVLEWSIQTADVGEAVNQLSRLQADDLQKITTIAGLSTLKRALARWDEEQTNAREDFWQAYLTKYPFVLTQVFSAPVLLIEGRAFAGGKGIENRGGKYPDFFLRTATTSNILIVEIKTPRTPLLGAVYRGDDVFPLSSEVVGAIAQTLQYKDSLLKEFATIVLRSKTKFRASMPQCLVIAGHTNEFENDEGRVQSFDLFRNNLRECSLITFDELFARTKSLVELLETPYREEKPF